MTPKRAKSKGHIGFALRGETMIEYFVHLPSQSRSKDMCYFAGDRRIDIIVARDAVYSAPADNPFDQGGQRCPSRYETTWFGFSKAVREGSIHLLPGLTPAQRKWLLRLADGVQTKPYGDNFGAFDRVMERLCLRGLARPYVHGGYEITDLGRRIKESP